MCITRIGKINNYLTVVSWRDQMLDATCHVISPSTVCSTGYRTLVVTYVWRLIHLECSQIPLLIVFIASSVGYYSRLVLSPIYYIGYHFITFFAYLLCIIQGTWPVQLHLACAILWNIYDFCLLPTSVLSKTQCSYFHTSLGYLVYWPSIFFVWVTEYTWVEYFSLGKLVNLFWYSLKLYSESITEWIQPPGRSFPSAVLVTKPRPPR